MDNALYAEIDRLRASLAAAAKASDPMRFRAADAETALARVREILTDALPTADDLLSALDTVTQMEEDGRCDQEYHDADDTYHERQHDCGVPLAAAVKEALAALDADAAPDAGKE